jgi:hypothetical protein
VNSLWFLSFIISVFCALLATLLQQWARRYLENTQPARCSPEKRARLRSFFAGGVVKMKVSWAVGSLSVLVHLSLFLFFSGLIIFLHNINHKVYLSVIWCLGIFLTVYGCFTIMPMFLSESPYNTPLTLPAVFIICTTGYFTIPCALYYTAIPPAFLFYLLLKCLGFLCAGTTGCFRNRLGHCLGIRNRGDTTSAADPTVVVPLLHRFEQFSVRQFFSVTNSVSFSLYSRFMKSFFLQDAIEDPNIFPLSKIDLGILDWSVGALGEAEELENVIEAIPGFLDSQKVKDLKKDLPDRSKLIKSLGQFLGRTLLSSSLSEQVKTQRVEICMNAANKICDSNDINSILRHLSRLHFDGVPQTIQTVQRFAGWFTDGGDHESATSRDHDSAVRRKIVARILPHVQERDNGWIALARDQFGVQEDVLRDNIDRGDSSVLLAIELHAIRNRASSIDGLSSLSRFDILDTDPQLQNEFCALWNELVLDANRFFSFRTYRNLEDVESAMTAVRVLRKIRHLYIALHQGTDSAPIQFSASTRSDNAIFFLPTSYPSCNIHAHRTHHPISTVPPTRYDDPEDASTHSSLLEIQPIPDGTTSSQIADESLIISGYLPSQELAHLAHEFPSSSQTANLVHVAPQATSATLTSDHGFFDRAPPYPPSVSVQPGDFFNTLSLISLALTSFHPPADNVPRNVTARYAASDITEISSSTHHMPQSISNVSIIPQASDGAAIVLPIVVSDSHSLSVMTSVPRGGHIPSVPPPSMESAPVLSDHVSRPVGSTPPTLIVPHSQITPHVNSVLDVHDPTSFGSRVPHGHDETRDPNARIPMEASLHADQSRPSTHDIARDPVRPGLHRHDQY